MFIAHLPGGLLVTRYLLRKHREEKYFTLYLVCGLAASIAPDLDLLYFYFIDHRQHAHHSYWTHIPAYWFGLYLLLLFPAWRMGKQRGLLLLNIVLLNGLLHMVLDSVASSIKWLYPVQDNYLGLFHVPSLYNWWINNYLFHWTFLFEIVITFSAVLILYRDRFFVRQLSQLTGKRIGFRSAKRYD